MVEPDTLNLQDRGVRIHYKARLTGAVTANSLTHSDAKVIWSSSPSGMSFLLSVLYITNFIFLDARNRSTNSVATVLIASPNVTFVVQSSSLPETLGNHAAVGETMNLAFSINVPQGRTNNTIVVVDVEKTGLIRIVGARVAYLPSNVQCLLAQDSTVALKDSNSDGTADSVEFKLGDIVNTPDGVSQSVNDTVILEVRALVVLSPNNTDGRILTASSQMTYNGSQSFTIPTPDVYMVVTEPSIAAVKTPEPVRELQAGDTVVYTITLTHYPNSTAPMYEAIITDDLSPLLDLVVGSVVPPPGGLVLRGNSAGEKIISVWVAPFSNFDSPINITYNATISSNVRTGDALPNRFDMAYYSSSPSVYNANNIRSYSVSNSTTVYTPAPVLSVFQNSSNLETPEGSVTVGEVISFISNISLPHGTIQNATLRVWVPTEGARLSMIHAKVILLDGTIISLANSSIVEGLTLMGDDSNNDTVPDSIFFNFGTIVNEPDDIRSGPNDRIVVEVLAVVLNIPENVDGRIIHTYSEFIYVMDAPLNQTQFYTNHIREPRALFTSKTWFPFEKLVAGDQITFNVSIDHTYQSTAPAFDMWIVNNFPVSMQIVSANTTQGEVVPNGHNLAIHVRAFLLNSGPINVTYVAEVSPLSPASSWISTWTNITYQSSLVHPNNTGNIRNRTDAAWAYYTTPDPFTEYLFTFAYIFFFIIY